MLAVSAIAIAATAILALNTFVIRPIAERSADDEAALLVLSAQTWVELPPNARPYFELELAQNHDLIISPQARDLPAANLGMSYLDLLQAKLAERLGTDVRLMDGSLAAALMLEKYAQGALVQTDDKIEGITAFLEKRKPDFHGR